MKASGLTLIAVLVLALSACSVRNNTTLNIHADQIRYKMAGGIGASWHAISMDSIDESPAYKYALRYKNSRGSAWGGNPPVADTAAWNQLLHYADWLGFTWIRVELSARMYEPEKNKFTWKNEEMDALCKILDWAESAKADVFLQQMWSNVKWNSYPGVQPLLSAPASVGDFSEGIGALLDYLLNERKYTCIKWVCITNEPPGGSWGSWWSTGEKEALLTPALREVRMALDRKKINIPVSGPDWTDLPVFDSTKIDFDQYVGAYDIHSYQGMDETKQKILEQWARWADSHNKPLFLSEMGDMRLGWGGSDPGPKSFRAALSNAETVLRGMAAGVGAFNRWSFTNRGDLDGQWQLIHTWDTLRHEYCRKVTPEPAAFYGYAIITRFCSKNSFVVNTEPIADTSVLSQTVMNRRKELTTYILNRDIEKTIRINLSGAADNRFYLYCVTQDEADKPGFRMDPIREIIPGKNGRIVLRVPARSICALTNMHPGHDDPAENR